MYSVCTFIFRSYAIRFLTGGWPRNPTEILDLECESFQCNANLPTFPHQIDHAVGGMVGKVPLICGGEASQGVAHYGKQIIYIELQKIIITIPKICTDMIEFSSVS